MNLWTKLKAICLWTKVKIICPLCIRHKKKTFYQSMVFWNMRCWLTRACRRMGWTWLENLSSGRPEGRGAALTLVVRYYYLACTYIRSPILRSCCRQDRLPYTPPINRWLAQSKNWLSSNLSINFEPSRSKWADELSKGCHHINDPGSGHIEEFPCWCCQGVYFSIVLWADYLKRSMHSDPDWIWFGLPEKWVTTIGFLLPVIF